MYSQSTDLNLLFAPLDGTVIPIPFLEVNGKSFIWKVMVLHESYNLCKTPRIFLWEVF